MEIKLKLKPRKTLTEFANEHNLALSIGERTPNDMGKNWKESFMFFASFDNCEVKDGAMLSSVCGNGASHDAAIHGRVQYCSKTDSYVTPDGTTVSAFLCDTASSFLDVLFIAHLREKQRATTKPNGVKV